MRPVLLGRCSPSKARVQICGPTRQGSSVLDRSEFLCVARVFAMARLTGAVRHYRRTPRSRSIRTVWYRVLANRALPESEVGLWFDPATGDRCVRLQRV